MWLEIIKYWKSALIATLALIITLGVFYCKSLHREIKSLDASLTLANANYSQCLSDQRAAQEVSSEYQASLSDLNSRLNKLRQQSKCVQVSPIRPDATPANGKLSGSNGIRSGWLIDFSGRCEQTRLQLIGLQSYVKLVCTN